MNTIVLDIETIASPIADADRETIEAMAAKREQDADTFCALCPALARVVAVGLMNVDSGNRRVVFDASLVDAPDKLGDIDLVGHSGEEGVVRSVHGLLKGSAKTLVTFNGRGYDIPLLLHRAVVHGVAAAPIVNAAAWQKPWENRPHVDMLAQLTFGGATGKFPLAAYAIAHGVGNPKTGGDGSHVAELVRQRDGQKLCQYVSDDVEATRALAQRWGLIP